MRIIKKILIIDGYNIINSWKKYLNLPINNLEHSREILIDFLMEYSAITDERIVVVFDSYLRKSAVRTYENRKNIEIVFTKEYETADNYIEFLVLNAPKNEMYRVASNDGLIQTITFGQGAIRISATELYNEIKLSKESIIKNHKKKVMKKINILSSINEDDLNKIEKVLKSKKRS